MRNLPPRSEAADGRAARAISATCPHFPSLKLALTYDRLGRRAPFPNHDFCVIRRIFDLSLIISITARARSIISIGKLGTGQKWGAKMRTEIDLSLILILSGDVYFMNGAFRKALKPCTVRASSSANRILSTDVKLKHDLPCIRARSSGDTPLSKSGRA